MMQYHGDSMLMGIGIAPGLFALVIVALLFVLAVRILHKAGYSGWWSLLGLIPIVNVIMVWVFAFADWPRLRKPEAAAGAQAPPPGAPPAR